MSIFVAAAATTTTEHHQHSLWFRATQHSNIIPGINSIIMYVQLISTVFGSEQPLHY